MLRRGAKKTHERKFVTVDRAAPHKGRAEDSASLGPAQSRGGPIDGVDPASRGLGVLQRRQEDKRLSGRRVPLRLDANPERRQAQERDETTKSRKVLTLPRLSNTSVMASWRSMTIPASNCPNAVNKGLRKRH